MTTHPSVAAYNKGCRCADCKAAVAAYKVEYRERKASGIFTRLNVAGTNAPIPHGTTTGYNHHKCRCQPCRDARAQYQRDRRESQPVRVHQSRPSSVPIEPLWARIESASGARIEDLNLYEIADMCGVTRDTVARWRRTGHVSLALTDRVAVSLGWHPAAIWGAPWYISTASEAA